MAPLDVYLEDPDAAPNVYTTAPRYHRFSFLFPFILLMSGSGVIRYTSLWGACLAPFEVRALRRPPRARALPCEGLHRCGHSVRWGRRICICASPEGRQAAGFQSDVGLRRDDEGAPGPSALATAGLELRGSVMSGRRGA